ncbi:MAG: tRNA uridine-5-carboxymethylaminomethyl(34) synthesis GTPase MnmE [Kiritimatiellae bacterium]|nr:tRNA uridine-5-carboxymethylaminomethyl(34) synthesis GTPase MnmE [Kiritimatiellia bacterium]
MSMKSSNTPRVPAFNDGTDTIAAIATAPGEGAVAIVRLSGPESLQIADVAFSPMRGPCASERTSHTVCFGRVTSSDGRPIDESLMLIMRGPHSFTGEDVVEFQGHGGRIAASRILKRMLECGARSAEPGEFTRRAFMNGKMDMLQAESVLDLVRAQSDMSAARAIEQMEGGLSREINSAYDHLLHAGSELEATLDFSEDEIPETAVPECVERIDCASNQIRRLLASWEEGRVLREGIRVTILGRPNAGKSSLFNMLLEQDRAIVSPHPGTTRDTLEECVIWGGWPVRLTDTAGLRDSECSIEQEGVRRSRKQQAESDLALYVADAHLPPHPDDLAYLSSAPPARTLLILNKSDLGRHAAWESSGFINESIFSIATDPAYKQRIVISCVGRFEREFVSALPHPAAISERHRHELDIALRAAESARDRLCADTPSGAVLACESIREATSALGRITGREYSSELLNAIFGRFCIGK